MVMKSQEVDMAYCPYFIDDNGEHGSSWNYVPIKASPKQMALTLALIGQRVPANTPQPPPLSRRLRARLAEEAASRS
jgi:hypothetical protein